MQTTQKRIALVTGVSSGIGKAVALSLAKNGYEVFGTSRRAEAGTVIDGIRMLALDVTSDQSVSDAVKAVLQSGHRLDLLVNNAGFGVFGGAEESSIEQAKSVFDTNLFGVARMTRAVLPVMRNQGHGRIINISSVLGFIPSPYMAFYCSSKYALEGYSESLDHEVRDFGIRVMLVEPAYTRTAFEQNMSVSDEAMTEYTQVLAGVRKIVSGVMETADDPNVVAEAVLKAATDTSPKLRYPAGKLAKRLSVLRRFVPSSMFDSTLRKQLRLTPTK